MRPWFPSFKTGQCSIQSLSVDKSWGNKLLDFAVKKFYGPHYWSPASLGKSQASYIPDSWFASPNDSLVGCDWLRQYFNSKSAELSSVLLSFSQHRQGNGKDVQNWHAVLPYFFPENLRACKSNKGRTNKLSSYKEDMSVKHLETVHHPQLSGFLGFSSVDVAWDWMLLWCRETKGEWLHFPLNKLLLFHMTKTESGISISRVSWP